MTLPAALQSSQDAHGSKLIDQYILIWYVVHKLFKQALATQAASDLRLCFSLFFFLFFLFFLFSSLLLFSQAFT
jgi:hypothetical protein